MKPGNLVKITRASIGVPKGTIAMITELVRPEPVSGHSITKYYVVRLFGVGGAYASGSELRERRYLGMDLELLS